MRFVRAWFQQVSTIMHVQSNRKGSPKKQNEMKAKMKPEVAKRQKTTVGEVGALPKMGQSPKIAITRKW